MMPYNSIWSLNLQQAKSYLTPYNGRPVEFMRGNSLFKSESEAMGGSQFQHHRNIRTSVYVKNAIPTENGYESKTFKEICSVNAGTKLEYIHDCEACTEAPYLYPRSSFVTSHTDGSILLANGTVVQFTDVQDCSMNFRVRQFKGLDTSSQNIKGIQRVGVRTIVWTHKELYYNGQEDFYDFIPALRTGAGKFSIAYDLGAIKQVISFGNGFYVLGTRGGVVSTECTGDAQYPFKFEKIENFDGISHPDNARSSFEYRSIYVMSHSGLQLLSGTQAKDVFPDDSRALKEGILTETNWLCQPDKLWRNSDDSLIKPLIDVQDTEEYLDKRTQIECPSYLFEEKTLKSDCNQHIQVSNINSRYTLISFGAIESCQSCEESEFLFTRLMVLDRSLSRYTLFHVEHTDTGRSPRKDNYPFVIVQNNEVHALVDGGIGEILFSDLRRSSGKSTTISQIDLKGRFNTDYYKNDNEKSRHTYYVPFGTGQDELLTKYESNLELSGYGSHEINYSGRVLDPRLSFILPFSGRINELILHAV
jgi:hypothetical protein